MSRLWLAWWLCVRGIHVPFRITAVVWRSRAKANSASHAEKRSPRPEVGASSHTSGSGTAPDADPTSDLC